MENGSIEREIQVDATPEVVFAVVSDPEHVRRWWPDEAEYDPAPGGTGRIGFGKAGDTTTWEQFTVVEAVPPRLFSFRWTHAAGSSADVGNSFLVVFEIEPDGSGSRVRMTETGFRERGWDEATVAAAYADHVQGWDYFLPRLPEYAASVAVR